jgi:hypothetical protein
VQTLNPTGWSSVLAAESIGQAHVSFIQETHLSLKGQLDASFDIQEQGIPAQVFFGEPAIAAARRLPVLGESLLGSVHSQRPQLRGAKFGLSGVAAILLKGLKAFNVKCRDVAMRAIIKQARLQCLAIPIGGHRNQSLHCFNYYGLSGASSQSGHAYVVNERNIHAMFVAAEGLGAGVPIVLIGDFNTNPLLSPTIAAMLASGR